jgi:two-component system OmpR family sensor kinase
MVVIHLPHDARPDWLANTLPPGFHTLSTSTGRLRVFIADSLQGTRTVVGQSTDVRDEITINSALRTLIPLLLLLPILAWLTVRIIRSELAPVTRLAQDLDEQSADRPGPLPDDGLPDEISPFVHAINRLLERVNSLMEQQRRFVADAAHELRSPLTALSVQAQNLKNADSLETMRERLAPLQAGIERARHLTEQLLSLAKTQAEANNDTSVDVSAMARELIAEYLPMAEARGIDLGLDEIASLSISASPEVLRQILRNALENALKYLPDDGQVSLRLLSDGEYAVIEVVDNGPGIPLSERERVFDSFYRIPGSTGQGNGLGLSIAREAAIRLGGSVSLHGRQGDSGLVFRYRQKRKI